MPRTLPAVLALLFLTKLARGDQTPARICIDRLRLGERPTYTESPRLYRERALRFSMDGGAALRVTADRGGWIEGSTDSKHAWKATYDDGKTYEADRINLGGQPRCLYYRSRFGHFESMELTQALDLGRCTECRHLPE